MLSVIKDLTKSRRNPRQVRVCAVGVRSSGNYSKVTNLAFRRDAQAAERLDIE